MAESPPPFSAVLNRQRSNFDASARMAQHSQEFYKIATSLAGRQQVQIEEVWPHIAWSCDVALHTLEVCLKSPTFFSYMFHSFS